MIAGANVSIEGQSITASAVVRCRKAKKMLLITSRSSWVFNYQFLELEERSLSKILREVAEPWRQIGYRGNASMRVRETIDMGSPQEEEG